MLAAGVTIAVAALAAAAIILWLAVYLSPWRAATRRRVLVALRDEAAIEGVLWRQRGDVLVLRGADLLLAGQEPRPLDGEVIVELRQVAFVQALFPAESRAPARREAKA